MNMKKLNTLTKAYSKAPAKQGIPTPIESGNTSRVRDVLASRIVAAFAGDAYGSAILLDGIRGGVDLDLLKSSCISNATQVAINKPDLGYMLDKAGKLDTRKGKGKTLNNCLSMATTSLLVCLPNMGESLSAWDKRAKNKPAVIKPVPTSGQAEPERFPVEPAVIKPVPTSGQAEQPEQRAAKTAAAAAIVPFETAPIAHAAPLPSGEGTASTKDDIGAFLDLADASFDDAQLAAVIAGLIAMQTTRTNVKLASGQN